MDVWQNASVILDLLFLVEKSRINVCESPVEAAGNDWYLTQFAKFHTV